MKLSQEQYNQIVNDVEQELSTLLAKSESEISQPLVKAEESEAEEKKEDSQEAKDNKAEDKQDEKKEDEKHDEACDYDQDDMEEMHKMYHSMSKPELKAHKDTMEKCWMAKCGDMQMAKSETIVETVKETPVVDTKDLDLAKSENSTLKKENDDLKKNIESLVTAMNGFLSKKAPERKAVTDLSFIAKSEEKKPEQKQLTKTEVTKILGQKAMDAGLSKNDRELINNYYLNNATVETVSHLLK